MKLMKYVHRLRVNFDNVITFEKKKKKINDVMMIVSNYG